VSDLWSKNDLGIFVLRRIEKKDIMTKEKSKAAGQRMVLAAVAGGKVLGEAFTKGFDTYKEKHEASEKKEESEWFEDLLRNTSKSLEEMLRHVSKSPGEVVDTYLDEEEQEQEQEQEVKKKEQPKEAKEKAKEAVKEVVKEKVKAGSSETKKPGKVPVKTVAKAVSSKNL